jgi:hypothetical protein
MKSQKKKIGRFEATGGKIFEVQLLGKGSEIWIFHGTYFHRTISTLPSILKKIPRLVLFVGIKPIKSVGMLSFHKFEV